MSLEKKIVLSCPWKKKCLFEIDGPSLDLLAAGHCENLAINSQSSPLALQFLVQQRHFMSSVPVVRRSDSSCTAHQRSDPLKRTAKLQCATPAAPGSLAGHIAWLFAAAGCAYSAAPNEIAW